jgi:hypothetical protein
MYTLIFFGLCAIIDLLFGLLCGEFLTDFGSRFSYYAGYFQPILVHSGILENFE